MGTRIKDISTTANPAGYTAPTTISAAGNTNITLPADPASDDYIALDGATNGSRKLLAPQKPTWFKVTVSAGSGSYTRTLSLQSAGAVDGSEIDMLISMPASTNPLIEFHNLTSGGTLLGSLAGLSTAINFNARFRFDGTNWSLLSLIPQTDSKPIGTIANTPLDSGTWLAMNGQVVSQSTYATLFAVVGHQPEFAWTVSVPLTQPVIAVCYGNAGTYVGVGTSGGIFTSTDAITWTSRTSGVATSLNAVTWDSTNSLFIAVGASNVILTSPDGTTWTSRTSGVTSNLANVLSIGGRTVAVGTSGWVTYSTNGTSWTATQPNSGPTLTFLLYANSVWFACNNGNAGVSNGIVYSTDGSTWNYTAKPTTNSANFAGFDGTYFYLSDTSNYEVFKSTTGASWTDTGKTTVGNISGNPFIFSSGVLFNQGPFPFYTSDGYTTLHKTNLSNIPAFVLAQNGPVCNPLGTTQKFAIATISLSTNGSLLAYSKDGINWSTDSFATTVASAGGANLYSYRYWNGTYFFFISNNRIVSAPDPYDTASQFQIPTRLNGAGSNFWIKAL